MHDLFLKKLSSNFKVVVFSSVLTLGFSVLNLANQASANDAPKTSSKVDIAAGEALYSNGDASRGIVACVGCHGANGNSATGTWPKLAGQHPEYTTTQLKHFKSGERANAVMMGMSAMLQENDMKNISAYVGKQKVSSGAASNKETIELGQKIYRGGIAAKNVPACASCHGPAGAGLPVQYPRLGGQWEEYTSNQLTTFRAGARKNAQMNTIASRLSDTEIKAVSDYIAGLHN